MPKIQPLQASADLFGRQTKEFTLGAFGQSDTLVLRKISVLGELKAEETAAAALAERAEFPVIAGQAVEVSQDAVEAAVVVASCQVQPDKYTWKELMECMVDDDCAAQVGQMSAWCRQGPEKPKEDVAASPLSSADGTSP